MPNASCELPLGNSTNLRAALLTGRKKTARRRRYQRLETARKVVPGTRIAKCGWELAHGRSAQVVLAEDGTAGLAGVTRCGLRACPNCAAIKALEDFHRAARVAQAMVAGGSMLVMTAYTMRHQASEPLQDTKGALIKTLECMYRSRRYKAFCERYGFTGERFYGNEITDGANGWHFHRHEVNEAKPPHIPRDRAERRKLADKMEHELTTIYLHELRRQGRTAERGYAVKITLTSQHEDPETAAAYVTKMALEVTYRPAKQGRRGGRSPWELLDDASCHELSSAQRARARARYREFVDATKGMHWTWFSDGCAAGENGEEAPWSDEPGVPVLDISEWQWRCLRSQHRICWLLELVESVGAQAAGDELRRWTDSARWTHRFRWKEAWEERPGGELMDEQAF
jgi:hypothetical protein